MSDRHRPNKFDVIAGMETASTVTASQSPANTPMMFHRVSSPKDQGDWSHSKTDRLIFNALSLLPALGKTGHSAGRHMNPVETLHGVSYRDVGRFYSETGTHQPGKGFAVKVPHRTPPDSTRTADKEKSDSFFGSWVGDWSEGQSLKFLETVGDATGWREGCWVDADNGFLYDPIAETSLPLGGLADMCQQEGIEPHHWGLVIGWCVESSQFFAMPERLRRDMSDYDQVADGLRVTTGHPVLYPAQLPWAQRTVTTETETAENGLSAMLWIVDSAEHYSDGQSRRYMVDKSFTAGWDVDVATAIQTAAQRTAERWNPETEQVINMADAGFGFQVVRSPDEYTIDTAFIRPDLYVNSENRGAVVVRPTSTEVLICAETPVDTFKDRVAQMFDLGISLCDDNPSEDDRLSSYWVEPGVGHKEFMVFTDTGAHLVASDDIRQRVGLPARDEQNPENPLPSRSAPSDSTVACPPSEMTKSTGGKRHNVEPTWEGPGFGM